MFVQTLLSGVLLVLPIAVTLGLYIGIEYQKLFNDANGRFSGNFTPPHTGDGGHEGGNETGGGSGGGGGHYDPGQIPLIIETKTYCQKFNGIVPDPGKYLYNPNQWGDPGNTGDLCMNITTSNKVKATDQYASNYSVTWHYPQVASSNSNPVHAYPNVKLVMNDSMVAQVKAITKLPFQVDFSYAAGSKSQATTDHLGLEQAGLNANVAVDMFLSDDKKKSKNTTLAGYEIMIWLAKWGLSTKPIGFETGSVKRLLVNQTWFDLFHGQNFNTKQQVYTWIAEQNTTSFVGDLLPLVTSLSAYGMNTQAWLGYMALGSEALYSPDNGASNVTFHCSRLMMDIET